MERKEKYENNHTARLNEDKNKIKKECKEERK
jgi:hypothetical protein